jgi:hypothetical protein
MLLTFVVWRLPFWVNFTQNARLGRIAKFGTRKVKNKSIILIDFVKYYSNPKGKTLGFSGNFARQFWFSYIWLCLQLMVISETTLNKNQTTEVATGRKRNLILNGGLQWPLLVRYEP